MIDKLQKDQISRNFIRFFFEECLAEAKVETLENFLEKKNPEVLLKINLKFMSYQVRFREHLADENLWNIPVNNE